MQQNELINLNICLSDIPAEARIKGRNGKTYCNLIISARREPDQFGNDITLTVSRSEQERKQKKPVVYVGAGKSRLFDIQPAAPVRKSAKGTPAGFTPLDDLPF